MPAACGREVTMARRSKPAKIEPVVTSKCASGRPLLTGSAPQTEFNATRSKQTTKKFLTEARTHIRIFEFSTFTTQNLVQLIQRLLSAIAGLPADAEPSDNRPRGRSSNRNWPRNRNHRKQATKPHLTETRISHPEPRNRVSTRFCSKSRMRRNSLKTNARQISTRGHNHTPVCPGLLIRSLTSKEVSCIHPKHAVNVAQVFRPEAVRFSPFRRRAPSIKIGGPRNGQSANVSSSQQASVSKRTDAMVGKALDGQVALVTGGAKRIGRSIALRLASEGADVVVNYMESKSEAEQLTKEIRDGGRRAIAVEGDVSQRADVQKLFLAVESEFGRLDILVNNAGIFFPSKFEDLTEEQWDRIMNANLKSQFLCAQTAAPIMKRQGRGRIINLSSLGGLLAWPLYTHYCVSKAGTIMLTRCLARALAPEILVNSVAPGTIQFPGEAPDEEYVRRVPLHRTGTGDDIADAVAYLASAEFVTGQTIVVDGGRSLI